MNNTRAFNEENILFENMACLVVNKLCGEDPEALPREGLFPVHRLDRPVSGCQLFAKTREAASFLGDVFSGGFKEPRLEKLYWAIVEKKVEKIEKFESPEKTKLARGAWTELIHRISFDPKRNKSFARKEENAKGKIARLLYRVLGEGENYSFLEIKLLTGKHHQIRAQLAAEGFHIKGDLKYGARRGEKEGGIRLHARFLSFPNPLEKNSRIRAEAPPPLEDALWRAFAEAAGNRSAGPVTGGELQGGVLE